MGFLLGNESVQKELKLDDKQLEKAKELSEKAAAEMQEKREGLQDLSQEERRAKFMEINRELNDVHPQSGRRSSSSPSRSLVSSRSPCSSVMRKRSSTPRSRRS